MLGLILGAFMAASSAHAADREGVGHDATLEQALAHSPILFSPGNAPEATIVPETTIAANKRRLVGSGALLVASGIAAGTVGAALMIDSNNIALAGGEALGRSLAGAGLLFLGGSAAVIGLGSIVVGKGARVQVGPARLRFEGRF